MSLRDEPLIIPVKGGHAFGMLSQPSEPTRLAAVVLPGADLFANAPEFILDLSHALAADGFTTLRVDYLDFGESTGGVAPLDPDNPRLREVTAGVTLLRERGFPTCVLIGHCYGGRVALEAAARIHGIAGVVLLAPTTHLPQPPGANWSLHELVRRAARPGSWRGLFQPERRRSYARVLRRFFLGKRRHSRVPPAADPARPRVSPHLVHGLQQLHERKIPALVVYGEQDGALEVWRTASATAATAAALLAGEMQPIEPVILPGSVHLMRGEDTLPAITELVLQRARRLVRATQIDVGRA